MQQAADGMEVSSRCGDGGVSVPAMHLAAFSQPLLAALPIGVACVDGRGCLRYANPVLAEILGGYVGPRVDAVSLAAFVCEEDRPAFAACVDSVVAGGAPAACDVRVLGGDGRKIWCRTTAASADTVDPGLILVLVEDIDSKKRFALTMQRIGTQYELILQSASEGVFGTDANGVINFINPSALNMIGCLQEEVLGCSVGAPMPGLDGPIVDVLSTGTPRDGDLFPRFGGGRLECIAYRCAPVFESAAVVGVVVLFCDISERKRAERALAEKTEKAERALRQLQQMQSQLLQSEKMASIGQLASGVAHEINNPIGFVTSNLGTLRTYVNDLLMLIAAYERGDPEEIARVREAIDFDFVVDDVQPLLAQSLDGVARVSRVVGSLKDFAHPQYADVWRKVDLHAELETTLTMLAHEFRERIEVVREYGVLPEIECLPSHINQVFMNLLTNAAHAIGERGIIRLRSGCLGQEIWIEVADTGSGIPPEHLSRIFDPFFTTKPVGTGTGFGLSLCHSIVGKHGGRIEVDSTPGCGSCFRLWLPVTRGAGASDACP